MMNIKMYLFMSSKYVYVITFDALEYLNNHQFILYLGYHIKIYSLENQIVNV